MTKDNSAECSQIIEILMGEIASQADSAIEVITNGMDADGSALQSLLIVVHTALCRIGTLADMGSAKFGGNQRRGGPEEWLLVAGVTSQDREVIHV